MDIWFISNSEVLGIQENVFLWALFFCSVDMFSQGKYLAVEFLDDMNSVCLML